LQVVTCGENADITAEEDILRAPLYALLDHLLAVPADAATLAMLSRLQGDETALGMALAALGRAAREATPATAVDEYEALFVGLTEGELRPYASSYLTGFLHDKPLAALRRTMRTLGVVRAPDIREPEDHVASLCAIMNGLILGRFAAPAELATQRVFFGTYLQPWAGQFFADLTQAEHAELYRPVGALGSAFMRIEQQAFAMLA
jgi:TorA maturation chaperone TorD